MDSKFIYNNRTLKERRKELRNKETPAEKLLWKYISGNKLAGMRFFRQYSVGPYILDFFCPKLRLGIELDGSFHVGKKPELYDEDREKYLNGLDIVIIRFWNDDVLKNTKRILNDLQNKIKQLKEKIAVTLPLK